MSILISALAIAVAQPAQPATTAPATVDYSSHAQQQGQKHEGDRCCSKKMGEGKKMECCAKHREGHGGERGNHSAH